MPSSRPIGRVRGATSILAGVLAVSCGGKIARNADAADASAMGNAWTDRPAPSPTAAEDATELDAETLDASPGPPPNQICRLSGDFGCQNCVRAQCIRSWAELNQGPCGPAARCVTSYCLCGAVTCPEIALCSCVDSCDVPRNGNGCSSHWQALYACIATSCRSECAGFAL
jgi:hypothetical protein